MPSIQSERAFAAATTRDHCRRVRTRVAAHRVVQGQPALRLQLEQDGGDEGLGDKWLPGVVRGHGHDGRRITVRYVLNHTSGIADHTQDAGFGRA